jgi:hypothetical protein
MRVNGTLTSSKAICTHLCVILFYIYLRILYLLQLMSISDHVPLCDTHYSVDTSAVGTYLQPTKSTRLHNYITPLI